MSTKKFTPSVTRGPRLTPGEIAVVPPDDLGVEVPPGFLQKVLPYVMGVCMLGMIGIMVFTGTKALSPYMMMTPLMMIMMSLSMVGAGGGGGGKKVPEINADRKEYLRYLAQMRRQVRRAGKAGGPHGRGSRPGSDGDCRPV